MKKLIRLLLILILGLLLTTNSFGETVFQNNFESGTLGAFGWLDLVDGAITISTDTTHSGTYSMKANATASAGFANAILQTIDAYDNYYARFWVYLTSGFLDSIATNGENCYLFSSFDAAYNEQQIALYLEQSGGVKQLVLANFWTNYSATNFPSADTWHCIEIYLYRHDTSGIVSWWIDGNLIESGTGIKTGDYDSSIFISGLYCSAGVQGVAYFDDIIIDNSHYIGTGWRVQEGLAVGSDPNY